MNFNSTVVFCDNEEVCEFRRFPRLMLKNDSTGWELIRFHDMVARKQNCQLISSNFSTHELPKRLQGMQEVVETNGTVIETTIRYLDDK